MSGSEGTTSSPPSPSQSPEAGDIEAAEKLIMRWDSMASPSDDSKDRMLFDGGDRADAVRYLRAVDEIRRSISESTGSPRKSPSLSPSRSSSSPTNTIKIAMARLEDEFRNILVSRVNPVEIESFIDLSCLSMSSSISGDISVDHGDAEEEDSALEREGSSISITTSYRSTSSIREIELVPSDAIQDLRSIADRMISAGYAKECVQVYGSVRKSAVDHIFKQLGVEKLSIGDVQRLEWDLLESKIRRWIRAAMICVRIVFASERRLCELIFEGLGSGVDDAAFSETVKGAVIQLFGFAEAISIGRRSAEKLFKILDLHDSISDLLPDLESVFRSKSSESIYTQASEILTRLAEAARGILAEFESKVLHDPKTAVPGGTVHPMTRYVMNYINLISEYKPTLAKLIVTRPTTAIAQSSSDDPIALPEISFPENQLPLASHVLWIIVILQCNLENKATLYKDAGLSQVFLMNNVHYIVHKVKGSPELRDLIEDDYLKRLAGKCRQQAMRYQRVAWPNIMHCLRDEGIHVKGSFSSGVSKATLKDRFRSFNAAFDEAHRTQAIWSVPDPQLREELRISASGLLLPAYRAFLGRFRHYLESERHPELYIKYSVEDLEVALSDFFEGGPPSPHRRRAH